MGTVNIQYTEQLAAFEQWHYHFSSRISIADDMPVKCINICYAYRLPRGRSLTTNTLSQFFKHEYKIVSWHGNFLLERHVMFGRQGFKYHHVTNTHF